MEEKKHNATPEEIKNENKTDEELGITDPGNEAQLRDDQDNSKNKIHNTSLNQVNESKYSMNFGGLIALHKQQKKEAEIIDKKQSGDEKDVDLKKNLLTSDVIMN